MLREALPTARFLSTAPGRVNLLGEHVDYNDGVVLPAAIDRTVRLAAEPLPGRLVTLQALDLQQSVTFNLDDLDNHCDAAGHPLPGWALYPAGVAWTLRKNGLEVGGMRAVFTSNVPIGAGLSSSAAVEVAFAALWQKMAGWPAEPLTLARLCQQAENRYVGVNCGLMDQFASACGVEGSALMFDTRSLEFHPVPLPAHTVLVIADSGLRRELATSTYNDLRAACEEAVRVLKGPLPEIRALRDVTPAQFEKYAALLPEIVQKRARHVVYEVDRVNQVKDVLARGDAAAFGKLIVACHNSLRDDFEVSRPEIDRLVELACELPGCWGARLTGAGFGGCTVNLVQEDQADAFITGLRAGYKAATGRDGEVYLCRASQGVRVETLD